VISVPPLRERLQQDPRELRELVDHLLSGMLGGKSPALVARVEAAIRRAVGDDYAWPGNVREVEQAIRRVLLTGQYSGARSSKRGTVRDQLVAGIDSEQLTANTLLASYCRLLHEKFGTYEAVARRTRLDRRTVRKYLQSES